MLSLTHSALLDLLEDIFSTACISISSDFTLPQELHTTTLLISSARTATVRHLVELILHLLLSQPPFKHTKPDLWKLHAQRFSVWTRNHSIAFRESEGSNNHELPPAAFLNILTGIRFDLQCVEERSFGFVSELLLNCLKQLSPEGANRSLNIRGWVKSHAAAVNILGGLLHAVLPADWQDLDKHAEYMAAVWRCLALLCSGASWWSIESLEYRENMVKLGKFVLQLPIASILLRASIRVNINAREIHTTMTTLLESLERRLGVSGAGKINAFTPTPFSFPVLASLDRHDFTKDYEFANLRVLFASWINSTATHREAECYQAPWSIHAMLQHIEVHKKLTANPQSGVRIALIYIFNETQRGYNNSNPRVDVKAIELLKSFISHKHQTPCSQLTPVSSRVIFAQNSDVGPGSCVIANAEWVFPWLWNRRTIDLDFTMIMTSKWLIHFCSSGGRLTPEHTVINIIRGYAKVAFDVFDDLFRRIFMYEFVMNSIDPETTLWQIRKLLKIVLDIIVLIVKDAPYLLTTHLCMLVIKVFAESLDQEWILPEAWAGAVLILSKFTARTISEAVILTQSTQGLELLVPTFLRQMETVIELCENATNGNLDADLLRVKFEEFTFQAQFLVLLTKSSDALSILTTAHSSYIITLISQLAGTIARNSHLVTSSIKFAKKSYHDLLLFSSKPELAWMYAASVASLVELLVVLDFGLSKPSTLTSISEIRISESKFLTETMKVEIDNIIQLLMKGEANVMSYVMCSLCNLIALLPKEWWVQNPFKYFELSSALRNYPLLQETHKWCTLLPALIQAFTSLLAVEAPIRQAFLSSRWNLNLAAKLCRFIFSPSLKCPECGIPMSRDVSRILKIFLAPQPSWRGDLFEGAGLGRYSFLKYANIESFCEELIRTNKFEDAEAVLNIIECFEDWKLNAKCLKRLLEREWQARGKSRSLNMVLQYKVFTPIEGIPGVLAPYG